MRYLLALLVLITVGCKKDNDKSDPSPLPSVINLGGVWSGTYASTVDPIKPIILNLAQSGAQVTGTFNINSGEATGTLTGTVSGSEFDFIATQSHPCSGTYIGGADVTTSSMDGSFSGTQGCVGSVSGSFSASK